MTALQIYGKAVADARQRGDGLYGENNEPQHFRDKAGKGTA